MDNHKIYLMSFVKVYYLYIKKVERKGGNKEGVDEIILWLTGYSKDQLNKHLELETNFKDFFNNAPKLNPLRKNIKGKICGVQIEDIKEPLMQEIRYLDKLIDELAKGKTLEKILHLK